MRIVTKIVISEDEKAILSKAFCLLDDALFCQQFGNDSKITEIANRIANDIETLLAYTE